MKRRWHTVSIALVALLGLGAPELAHAQGGFLWQGVANIEGWQTDSASRLLARGNGRPSLLGRVDTWGAFEPIRNVILFGETLAEAGAARDEEGNEIYLKQYGLRFIPSESFSFEVGKTTQVVGTFSGRQLTTRNPLIGVPDGYGATYPKGARIDGNFGMVDYRAGVLNLPVWRDGYTPEPSVGWRPSFGLGITPMVGLRLGISGTVGSYLNDGYSAAQLKSRPWDDYRERILGWDAAFSRGYFEAHAEGAFSGYDVPGKSEASKGNQFYLESKYTFTPRLFAAARYERNDYPFIEAFGPVWVANNSVVQAAEVGAGYRLTANTLVKFSFRRDHWGPTTNPSAPHDDGHAFALQLSQSFDVLELLTRKQ